MIELRDYQKTISLQASELLKRDGYVYLSLEVRTGKTLTALKAAELFGSKKVLFLTKLRAIKSINDDYASLSPNFEIVVINNESMHKVEDNDFDLIISDEHHRCLIGETIVNDCKIKDIKVGVTTKSFNFVENKYEDKKILKVHRNKINENLIKIKCNGKEIVCTENHKIFTKRGWVRAKNIRITDSLQVVR